MSMIAIGKIERPTPLKVDFSYSFPLELDRAESLKDAIIFKRSLLETLGGGERIPLTDELFATNFDAREKTLVTFLSSEEGMVHTAVVAQRLREAGERVPNFVFSIPDSQLFHLDKESRTNGIYTTFGVMLTAEGNALYGRFPHPVRVDMFDQCCEHIGLRELLMNYDVGFVDSVMTDVLTEDKWVAKEILRASGNLVPPGFMLKGIESPKDIREQLAKLDGKQFVLKPDIARAGLDVVIGNKTTILKEIPTIIEKRKNVLIEERIASAPRKDSPFQDVSPKDLDWNLRVLATSRGVLDIEVRTGRSGKPINKYQGSIVEEFTPDIVATILERRQISFEDLRSEIVSRCEPIPALFKADFLGIDLIVDRDGNLWFLEVNSGKVGGIKTLCEIRNGSNKLDSAKGFARHLQDIIGARVHER